MPHKQMQFQNQFVGGPEHEQIHEDAQSPSRPVCIMVDPYSSGTMLVDELEQRQIPIVAVRSSLDLIPCLINSMDPTRFVRVIDFKAMSQLKKELASFPHIHSVIAGSEPGVMLAEQVQDMLGFPGNGSSTKEWRRSKYDQQERLRACGLRAIKQLFSSDLDEILKWRETNVSFPCIVKPSMSAGADGVYWCHSNDDIRKAYKANFGSQDLFGGTNNKLLVQEFLQGPEYVIDTVSREGRHVLVAIFCYSKMKDSRITCEYTKVVPSSGEVQDKLVDYIFKCLDALNIKYGPAHAECIFTSSGPCLVEVGNRMHGSLGPKVAKMATGLGQHELAVDAICEGKLFNEIYANKQRYVLKKFGQYTSLMNRTQSGILTDKLMKYPTVKYVSPGLKIGDRLPFTQDSLSAPAKIIQLSESEEDIMRDYEHIRAVEKAGKMYEVQEDVQLQELLSAV